MFKSTIRKLKEFLSSFNPYKEKATEGSEIPLHIENSENIIRSIFSPINLNKKKNTLLANTFRPPPDLDEISVNRLDFTSLNFCKKVSKKIEQPEKERSYFGLALLTAQKIRSSNSDIIYTPKSGTGEIYNPFHSDIKIGYIPQRGIPLPAEFMEKVQALTGSAKLFIDPDPTSETWDGEDV